ncbi:MAG: pyrroline-5-carboxylate reductase [Rickettsiales bacterium]
MLANTSSDISVLLVGCGNMGKAILSGWHKKPPYGVNEFYVIEPNGHSDIPVNENTVLFHDLSELSSDIKPDIIILAIKPQQFSDVLPRYKERFGTSSLYISIAAGRTIDSLAELLGDDAKIIRAMPNTPALVGKAITALTANNNTSDEQKKIASILMESFGKTIWVAEKDMDIITAISGSGPAYVFLFIEALTDAGIKYGLNRDTASTLAMAMVHGSVHLAEKSDKTLSELRDNVTSKGGTTEAALNVLTDNDSFKSLIEKAISAAAKRSGELKS